MRKKAQQATIAKAKTTVSAPAAEKPKTLWEIFIAGFVGGFLAVIMPCIYPLLPLTVSFFTKKAGNRAKGIRDSLIYGLSIIVIYVALGVLMPLQKATGLRQQLACLAFH